MRKLLILAIAAAPLALAAPTFASDDDEARCPEVPAAEWLSMGEIEGKLSGMGYQVRKIERERNCYEFEGSDAQGVKVEGYVNPKDGTIVPQRTRQRS